MALYKIISTIFHPVFMPTILFYLTLTFVPNIALSAESDLNFIYLTLLLTTIILPIVTVFFLIKLRVLSSLEMSIRKERPIPLFITTIWMGLGYYILQENDHLHQILKGELLGTIIIILFASAVSKYWKISLHMLGIGGVVGALLMLWLIYSTALLTIIIASVSLALILGFARLKEKAHTHKEIYVGFLSGAFIQIIIGLFFF
tara:strand:- start:118 stop:726 length:609 start_codon:yes stop_codon:yes gene_type:complete